MAQYQTYNDLVAQIKGLIARGDIVDQILSWITLAETTAVSKLSELTENIYITNGSLPQDQGVLVLPDGCSSIESFYLDTSPVTIMRQVKIAEMTARKALNSSVAQTYPDVFARIGNNSIEMAPVLKTPTNYTLYWTGQFPAVGALGYTSKMLVEAPSVLLYGAAQHAVPYLLDQNREIYRAMFKEAIIDYSWLLANQDEVIQMRPYSQWTPDHPQMNGSD